MGKRGKSHQKVKDTTNPKRRRRHEEADPEDMDDEIDAFHKQRDIVPLDVNGDAGDSDDDDKEEPVFDFQDDNEDDDEDGDNEDMNDDTRLTGFTAKIARQQKFMRAKFGGVEDDMHNEEEDEEDKKAWGGRKDQYYNADEVQSSDEEDEEAEVLRLQKEKAKSLSMEDFGLEDVSEDESDGEPTLEEIMVKGKSSAAKQTEEDMGSTFEEVKKDVNALSREEQMDVLYSSAPELVGLLSELKDSIEELEGKVNPLLSKVKERQPVGTAVIRFLEVKQLLLLSYCQTITFYLLLKSEGQQVRDHPVIARLVEIKSSLDKMKQLDGNLTSDLEEILNKKQDAISVENNIEEKAEVASGSLTKDQEPTPVTAEFCDSDELARLDPSKDFKERGGKHNHKNDQVGVQSMEMLKVRALLEEKLKGKGLLSSISAKPHKAQRHLKPVNGQLETRNDFDDDAMDVDGATQGLSNGKAILSRSNKLSQLVAAKPNRAKVISGDDDIPKRDDIGERRRKHELRVLSGAGINSEDDMGNELVAPKDDADSDMEEGEESGESEDELYEEVKKQRAAKLAAKAEIYSRTSASESLPETVDGKRQISYQMEKNRGLTRSRKKQIKNPRKKYKLKHKKAEIRRKGQVREIRKPSGPYGGEATGINAGISRSIRFKG